MESFKSLLLIVYNWFFSMFNKECNRQQFLGFVFNIWSFFWFVNILNDFNLNNKFCVINCNIEKPKQNKELLCILKIIFSFSKFFLHWQILILFSFFVLLLFPLFLVEFIFIFLIMGFIILISSLIVKKILHKQKGTFWYCWIISLFFTFFNNKIFLYISAIILYIYFFSCRPIEFIISLMLSPPFGYSMTKV